MNNLKKDVKKGSIDDLALSLSATKYPFGRRMPGMWAPRPVQSVQEPASDNKGMLQWATDSRFMRNSRSMGHSATPPLPTTSTTHNSSLRKIKSAGRTSQITNYAAERAVAAVDFSSGPSNEQNGKIAENKEARIDGVPPKVNRTASDQSGLLKTENVTIDYSERIPRRSASMKEGSSTSTEQEISANLVNSLEEERLKFLGNLLKPIKTKSAENRASRSNSVSPFGGKLRTFTKQNSGNKSKYNLEESSQKQEELNGRVPHLPSIPSVSTTEQGSAETENENKTELENNSCLKILKSTFNFNNYPAILFGILILLFIFLLERSATVADLNRQLDMVKVEKSAIAWSFNTLQNKFGTCQLASDQSGMSTSDLDLNSPSNSLSEIQKGPSKTPPESWEGMNPEKWRRKFALFLSILCLIMPIFFVYSLDHFHWLLGFIRRFSSGIWSGFRGFRRRTENLEPEIGADSNSGHLTKSEEEAPLSKRLAYKVDFFFSSYSWVKHLALLVATMLLISVGGLALYGVSGEAGGGEKGENEALSLGDAIWQAWTYVADAGNHADSEGLGPRVVSVTISFGGMLIFALMLGLVSDAISEKVDSLRKGRSEVIEKNHTLVLGWSDKLGPIVRQLAAANESLGGGKVVVLAERDKEEMEAEISAWEFECRGTTVVVRSGSPLVLADLKKVSVSTARAIVVLAEVENADQSDARALRVVLSLTGVKEGLRGHVVVELSDIDNEPLVKMVGGRLVETVVAHDVIGRLMIQCARQPGLAQIWEDILGFEGCEFYMQPWPQLTGLTFGEALLAFPEAIPCGVRIQSEGNRILLNPDDSYVLQEGDALLVVAEDDNSYSPTLPLPAVITSPLPDVRLAPKMPEKILFCGWRRDIDDMITVLEAFVARGSELWMFSDVPIEDRERRLKEDGLGDLENLRLVHRVGNAVIRRHLESLPLENFDSILILADEALEDTVMNADSRSLATLLLIRDIQSKRLPYWNKGPRSSGGGSGNSWVRQMQQASAQSIIISEILDSRTRSLVSVSKISDYVLSNELVSMALAMVAEDREINRVLEELFAEEGNEMYIRPAELYVYNNEPLSFFEVMVRARQRQEIVIGYRLANEEKALINPPAKEVPRRWTHQDTFVVFALEE